MPNLKALAILARVTESTSPVSTMSSIPGRPLIYGTTKKFLEVFDLKDLDSLPKIKEIRELGSDEQETAPEEEAEQPGKQPETEKSGEERPPTPEQTGSPPEA